MFISHYAVSLAGKRFRPELPMWLLLPGSLTIDFYSMLNQHFDLFNFNGHSLLFLAANMLVFGLIALIFFRSPLNILILILLPVSHFLMDLVTGKIVWWSGGPEIGLGLYAIPWLEFIIDSSIFAGCLLFYMKLFPKSKKRTIWLIIILTLFLIIQGVYNFFLS